MTPSILIVPDIEFVGVGAGYCVSAFAPGLALVLVPRPALSNDEAEAYADAGGQAAFLALVNELDEQINNVIPDFLGV